MKDNLTITFFSNFLLHHQTPFCEAMIKRIGDGFRFVATKPIPDDRISMGYRDYSNVPYVVYSYKSEQQHEEALQLGKTSDVVIMGNAPDDFIVDRIKSDKLTFRYHERRFRNGKIRILDPRVFFEHYKRDFRYRKKNIHMLCASAYTAPDYRFIHSYPNKMYKWGYFPEINLLPYEKLEETKSKNKKIKLIWVSRFIKLKHPEDIIMLAEKLQKDYTDFEIEMLGIGELRKEYEKTVYEKGLANFISFSGPFPPEEVLTHMRSADIFLFTSDKNEGWGAVLNEAMSSGCAVIANKEIGSVPYLIKDGENGLIYYRKDKNSLYNCVKRLIHNKPLREKLSKNAYGTIKNVWNADVAADRLLTLIDCINNNTETPFMSGPCSKD